MSLQFSSWDKPFWATFYNFYELEAESLQGSIVLGSSSIDKVSHFQCSWLLYQLFSNEASTSIIQENHGASRVKGVVKEPMMIAVQELGKECFVLS